MKNIEMTSKEKEARQMENCIACGNIKAVNAIVCWDCFKYAPEALMYWDGSFESWLKNSAKGVR